VENENGLYVTDDFILTHNTSLAKILMTKMLCFKERGYVNIDSYDKNNSETFLYDIAQNLLTNRRIIRDFGYIYQKKRSQEEMTMTRIGKFITKNDVLVEAHSVAESVRGRLYGAQRPDFVCGDDFETNKTKDSEAYTAVTKGHFEEFATGLDSRAGILYLGNYITKTGIVQWIMDRAKSDDKIRVRMVPIEEAGKPTWEAKYCMTDKEAEETNKISLESKKKQFDFVVYQTEMMNNPIGSDQQIFKKEMFKYISYDEVMKMNCRVFMTIDTAISQKTSADYTGISLIFVDREGFWNVMTFKRKMTPKQLLDFIFEYWEKYHIEEVGIEKTTFQMALKEFFEEEMRKRGKFPRIVDLLHRQQKKEERIRGALLGRYESGSIRHITNYIEGLEEELLAFPMSKNDDVCLTSHTLVATINGLKKISLIRKGDLVWTRKGLKKVLWSGKTGKKKVITKFGLSGTPNHPVWTENRGWIKLQSLKASDVLVFLENRLNGMEKNIIDTQNQNGDSSEYTSIPIQNFVNHRHHSIETFGNFLMEKLKSACTSITKMGLMTIGYLHSKSQHLLNMEENIGSQLKNSQEGSDGRRNLLQIHKKLLKDEIKKLQKENKKNLMRGMREIKLFSHIFRAKDVALFFETPHGEKSTIVSPAERKKDTFLDTYRLKNIQRGTAHTAVDISKTTAVMLNSVERIANTKEFCVDNGSVVDVYNIDVEDEHEYFANGILVHNCDSLSYGDQIAKSPFGEVKLVAKTYKPENCS
jgi:intein/homing endonuclease